MQLLLYVINLHKTVISNHALKHMYPYKQSGTLTYIPLYRITRFNAYTVKCSQAFFMHIPLHTITHLNT